MVDSHDKALKAIYVLALLILVGLVVAGIEWWERKQKPLKRWMKPVDSTWRRKHQRPWRKQMRPKPKKRTKHKKWTKPKSPVHAEYHVPLPEQECKEYSWEAPDTGPQMDEDMKEEGPSQRVPDPGRVAPWLTQEYKEEQREQAMSEVLWLRARLTHLLDEIDGVSKTDNKCN